jgi:hypothetical protein
MNDKALGHEAWRSAFTGSPLRNTGTLAAGTRGAGKVLGSTSGRRRTGLSDESSLQPDQADAQRLGTGSVVRSKVPRPTKFLEDGLGSGQRLRRFCDPSHARDEGVGLPHSADDLLG